MEKENKEFVWTDELVKELIISYNNIRNSIAGADPIMKEIGNFKKSKEPKPYLIGTDWHIYRCNDLAPYQYLTAFETFKEAEEYVLKNRPKAKEKEKPLWIADDGVGIYLNDMYYQVLNDWRVTGWRSDLGTTLAVRATFSTEKAANEYVEMNQPKYSIADIDWLYKNWLYGDNSIDFKSFLIKGAK